MIAFNVLPEDRTKLTKLLELHHHAKEQQAYYWDHCYFQEAYGWEEIASKSFNEIRHLVRKCTEANQVQTMLDQLRKRFANDPAVRLTEIEKRVMTDGWSWS